MNSKGKIAVGLYGQPRFYREGYIEIKKNIIDQLLLNGYEVDVYFHTWWHEDDIGMKFPRAPWTQLTEIDLTIKPGVLDWLLQHYKPVEYKSDSMNVIKKLELPSDAKGYDNNYSVPQCVPIFYTMKQLSGLIPDRGYLRVIKLRFDICFDWNTGLTNKDKNISDTMSEHGGESNEQDEHKSEMISEKHLLNMIESDKFLVGPSNQPNAVSDIMSISSYSDFIKSCEVYDNLTQLSKNTLFNMEQLFYSNLLLHNIEYEVVDFKYGLLRSCGIRFFPEVAHIN